MTKNEAEIKFDDEGEEALDQLLDYILIEQDYNKAADFIMYKIGCDEAIAREMVYDLIPKHTDKGICVPKCPTCGSIDISKLGIVNKYVSIHLVGLASNKVAKTFQCKNCGYTW